MSPGRCANESAGAQRTARRNSHSIPQFQSENALSATRAAHLRSLARSASLVIGSRRCYAEAGGCSLTFKLVATDSGHASNCNELQRSATKCAIAARSFKTNPTGELE